MIGNEKTALVVIDVQVGVFNKKIRIYKEKELIDNINLLTDTFHKNNMGVYFIRHTNKSMMVENSDDWQLHPGLHINESDILLNKENSSVFKEKTLHNYLQKSGVKHLIIAGLVTHGCVKAACQDAVKLGYDVILASDGHSSFNQNAQELINEWNKKLSDEGVKVISTSDILTQI